MAITSFNDNLVCRPFLDPSSSSLPLFPPPQALSEGIRPRFLAVCILKSSFPNEHVSHILWVYRLKTLGVGENSREECGRREGEGEKEEKSVSASNTERLDPLTCKNVTIDPPDSSLLPRKC